MVRGRRQLLKRRDERSEIEDIHIQPFLLFVLFVVPFCLSTLRSDRRVLLFSFFSFPLTGDVLNMVIATEYSLLSLPRHLFFCQPHSDIELLPTVFFILSFFRCALLALNTCVSPLLYLSLLGLGGS